MYHSGGDVVNLGAYVYREGDIWDISLPSLQLYCESETALKNGLDFLYQKKKKVFKNS